MAESITNDGFPKAAVGRIVIYQPSEHDKEARNNSASEVPAIIVHAWDDVCLNLKVFTDGNQDLWRTSVQRSDVAPAGSNSWRWPERV